MSEERIEQIANNMADRAIEKFAITCAKIVSDNEERTASQNDLYEKQRHETAKEYEEDRATALLIMHEKNADDMRIYKDVMSDISSKVDRIDIRLSNVEDRLTGVEDRLTGVEDRLDGLEGDVKQIKVYIFENVDTRVHILEMRDTATA